MDKKKLFSLVLILLLAAMWTETVLRKNEVLAAWQDTISPKVMMTDKLEAEDLPKKEVYFIRIALKFKLPAKLKKFLSPNSFSLHGKYRSEPPLWRGHFYQGEKTQYTTSATFHPRYC